MLVSMTGFGSGRAESGDRSVHVELRSVNNRHFKLTVRGSDPYPLLESEFEKLLRAAVRRGTITVFVRVERSAKSTHSPLNPAILQNYLNQLIPLAERLPTAFQASLFAGVLGLPGVAVNDSMGLSAPEGEWPLVEKAVVEALAGFSATRSAEGRAMAEELARLFHRIRERVAVVHAVLPGVVAEYRNRLTQRIRQAVATAGVVVDESNLIRELALFADRSDVNEELTRLSGHLDAADHVLEHGGEGAGRRLEFLAQEMGREANTLGSKAGNSAVSHQAVEIKADLERIRELVLNVE
jgi:uncharacterized protein (TIGR00255 family)